MRIKFNHIKIDCRKIGGYDDFHDIFSATFDFPGYYGRNMDAWIDCMSDYGANNENGFLILELENVRVLISDHPGIYNDLIECTAFINLHRFPMMALAYHRES